MPVGGRRKAFAIEGNHVWVVADGSDQVTKILASTGAIVGAYPVGESPVAVAFDGTAIWVANTSGRRTKLLPGTGSEILRYEGGICPEGSQGLLFDGTFLWTANGATNTITKLSLGGFIFDTYAVGAHPVALVFDGTNIWTANSDANTVTKLLVSSGKVVGTYPVGTRPVALAFDGVNIWTANSGANTVTKLLASTGEVVGTYPVGKRPIALTYDGKNIWVANHDGIGLTIFEAAIGAEVATYPLERAPLAIACDGVNIWVADDSTVKLLKGSSGKPKTSAPASTQHLPIKGKFRLWVYQKKDDQSYVCLGQVNRYRLPFALGFLDLVSLEPDGLDLELWQEENGGEYLKFDYSGPRLDQVNLYFSPHFFSPVPGFSRPPFSGRVQWRNWFVAVPIVFLATQS